MSFMFPRTLKVTRPIPNTGVGAQGYSGLTVANESVVASGVSASIQQPTRTRSGQSEASLPGDTSTKISFSILLSNKDSILGQITERDVVTDDLGKRYQVVAAVWSPLGVTLLTILLQD